MKLSDARLSPLFAVHAITMQDDDVIAAALQSDKAAAKVLAKAINPQAGDLVGIRLSLNILKSKGVLVQTIHAGSRGAGYKSNKGFYNREVQTYQKVVTLREAYFNVSQDGRKKIITTSSKYPMASIDGILCDVPEADFSGIEIGFNPHRVHLFADRNNHPIRFAEEVTIYGHRAYARGYVEYYTEANAPAKVGDAASNIVFPPQDTADSLSNDLFDRPDTLPQAALDLAQLLA